MSTPTLAQIQELNDRIDKVKGILRTFERDRTREEEARALLTQVMDYLDKHVDPDTPEGRAGMVLGESITTWLNGGDRG